MSDVIPAAAERPFQHHGRSRDIVAMALVNLLLNIVTLSWWRFWGKTRVRRFLWSHTTLWGDPLEYTGTGRELFLGFLVVMFLVFSPLMLIVSALQVALASGQTWAGVAIVVVQVSFVFLAGAGLYRAYRYQMTRTLWRGIRAGLRGSAWLYGLHILLISLAAVVSLGWTLPWGQMKLSRYRLGNTVFGDLAFECDAKARPVYGRFALCWFGSFAVLGPVFPLITILLVQSGVNLEGIGPILEYLLAFTTASTIGLSVSALYAWYRVGFYRHLAAGTRLDGHAFALDIRTWPLFRLIFGNVMISILSLGILMPWVAVRMFRFTCANLTIAGQPDFDRVNQSTEATPKLGEGLAAAFDGAGTF